jgi:DNA-binding NarL/FixJ family response regulator
METRITRNVRVLVANRPRLMRELVLATLFDQPDIEVVGEVENEADILKVVEEKRPDYLIVSLDKRRSRPPVCDVLLSKYPNMKILALAPEENSSVFYWASLDIHSFDVESSEDGILQTLRGGAKRRAQ